MGIFRIPGPDCVGRLNYMLAHTIEHDFLLKLGKVYPAAASQQLLELLVETISWQNTFEAFGRHFAVPRMQAWYADEGIHYRYSDNMLQSHAWIEPLRSVKNNIEQLTGFPFNSVLVTFYRDGHDHVNWHADDEAELGEQPVIASLSLGASREFHYRHKYRNENGAMTLHDGELLLMQPVFQHEWEHCVPVEYEVQTPRINLTFRNVIM